MTTFRHRPYVRRCMTLAGTRIQVSAQLDAASFAALGLAEARIAAAAPIGLPKKHGTRARRGAVIRVALQRLIRDLEAGGDPVAQKIRGRAAWDEAAALSLHPCEISDDQWQALEERLEDLEEGASAPLLADLLPARG